MEIQVAQRGFYLQGHDNEIARPHGLNNALATKACNLSYKNSNYAA
jgi:hypothetical protein